MGQIGYNGSIQKEIFLGVGICVWEFLLFTFKDYRHGNPVEEGARVHGLKSDTSTVACPSQIQVGVIERLTTMKNKWNAVAAVLNDDSLLARIQDGFYRLFGRNFEEDDSDKIIQILNQFSPQLLHDVMRYLCLRGRPLTGSNPWGYIYVICRNWKARGK